MKKSVQIERLTQLIRVLEEVKASKKPFYMETWYLPLFGMSYDQKSYIVGNKTHSCGTASCAAGWAAQDPWFKRRGFTLGEFDEDYKFISSLAAKTVKMRGDGTEFDACETFFDERDLFSPEHYLSEKITPSMVIAEVKKVIKSVESGVGAG